MNQNPNTHLAQQINRVCAFIGQHLDEPLTLDTLSSVAGLSKFHFHRMFTAYTGVRLAKFIQMSRLKRASLQLAFQPELKVIDIAFDAGFESPEAFARAFKREFGQTPSQFKTEPDWPSWHTKYQKYISRGEPIMDVTIVDFPETKVALLAHRGPADRVYETAAQFIAWRKSSKLSPVKTSKTFGIPHGDPKDVTPEDYRFDICGSIDRDVPSNDYGVVSDVIPGGRCAVINHQGSHANLEESVYYLYREWLPQQEETCRDFPCFFQYLNLASEVPENELRTDIYLPLE